MLEGVVMSAGRTTAEEKLHTLILLLASDQDGEVVAAGRTIVRTLKSIELDIHSLADRLTGGGKPGNDQKLFTEPQVREIYSRGFEDGRQEAERNRGASAFQSVDGPTWHEIACACAARPDRLRDAREQEFVEDMVRRLVHGGEPSERQANWLRKIYARRR
jgi:hypothetical protein